MTEQKDSNQEKASTGVVLERFVSQRDNVKVAIFAIYSIIFEVLVWGLFGYAVFWKGHSGWWFLLALLLSSAQLKPKRFGITTG